VSAGSGHALQCWQWIAWSAARRTASYGSRSARPERPDAPLVAEVVHQGGASAAHPPVRIADPFDQRLQRCRPAREQQVGRFQPLRRPQTPYQLPIVERRQAIVAAATTVRFHFRRLRNTHRVAVVVIVVAGASGRQGGGRGRGANR
jgi:hypothetical protein